MWSLLLFLCDPVQADEPTLGPYRFLLHGGVGGLAGTSSSYGDSASLGAGVVGRLVVHRGRWGFELANRSELATADAREVGALFVGARAALTGPVYARAGFAHNHEVTLDLAKAHPLEAVLGSLTGIRHRSGLELGLGATLPLEEAILDDRLAISADVGFAAFPDALGPRLYAYLDAGVTVHVGRKQP